VLQKDPTRRVPPGLPQAREVCLPDHSIMLTKNSTMTLRHKSVAKFLDLNRAGCYFCAVLECKPFQINEQHVICETLFLQIPLVPVCLQPRQAIDLGDHQG
jgi:hypothetical protein